jgi:hypothetical protein
MSTEWTLYCKANSPSIIQEIPHILWDLKVHHCAQKIEPPVPTPSHINPVHASNPATTLLAQVHPG